MPYWILRHIYIILFWVFRGVLHAFAKCAIINPKKITFNIPLQANFFIWRCFAFSSMSLIFLLPNQSFPAGSLFILVLILRLSPLKLLHRWRKRRNQKRRRARRARRARRGRRIKRARRARKMNPNVVALAAGLVPAAAAAAAAVAAAATTAALHLLGATVRRWGPVRAHSPTVLWWMLPPAWSWKRKSKKRFLSQSKFLLLIFFCFGAFLVNKWGLVTRARPCAARTRPFELTNMRIGELRTCHPYYLVKRTEKVFLAVATRCHKALFTLMNYFILVLLMF